MQTSLARRERRRRSGSRRPAPGGSNVRRIAIIVPLILFTAIILLGVMGVVTAVAAYNMYAANLPTSAQIKSVLENIDFSQTTRVYDRSGKIQLATFARERRDVVTFDQIAPVLVDATTAAEDKTFWENAGFDPVGIISAGLDTLSGRGRGASTITQQIVRNRLLPAWAKEGTVYDRKIREIIVSVRLTEVYKGDEGKKQIISAYLNDNFYGNNSYGVAAAARGYWNITDMSKLTLAQAALLAAIPKSPTSYDLMRNAVEQDDPKSADPEATILIVPPDTDVVRRRNVILDAMQQIAGQKGITQFTRGQYTDADFAAAKAEPVVLTPPDSQRNLAPQFVLQARHELGTILCPETPDDCTKSDTGGYTVLTTLDWKMQRTAEKWVQASARGPNAKNPRDYVKSLSVPYKSWIAHLVGQGVHNGALASVDYRTGQVYSYVGSAGFYLKGNKKFQPQFDVLEDGWRQPGSAFKPINYVIGIDDKTLTAASLFMDVVTDFGGGWTPANADPFEHGPLRLREALMGSLNIPAIKAGIEIGPKHVWERSRDFGIRWQTKGFEAGPSIAIGTVELHIIDLISAYGAIANGGVLMPRTTILEIRDSSGNKVWPAPGSAPKGKRVVSAAAAYVLTAIIASNTNPAENPFWGKLALKDGKGRRRPATLKTGTTNDTKDLTAVGYVAAPQDPKSPALVTGAWMGNSDNTAPPKGVFALETAASLWQDYMNTITKNMPIADFKRPKGVVQATVDAQSGMLPGPYTKATVVENFISGTVPKQRDNTKVGVEVDGATNKLWREGCEGPKVTKGFMDLSKVEAKYPNWKKYTQAWIARASRGVGIAGGPEGTVTQYFFGNGWFPFGRTWGAPFLPKDKCPLYTPSPSPSPGESPLPTDSPLPTPGP